MSAVGHSLTDNVVSLFDHRRQQQKIDSSASNIVSQRADSTASLRDALLIPFADRLTYSASLEIDFLRSYEDAPTRAKAEIMVAVRKLLRQEFGLQRVQRDEWIFSIRHHDIDSLIAGLLRVQFYAKQLVTSGSSYFTDPYAMSGVTVTWGVGHCDDEASNERRKRRQQKNLRR